MQKSKTETLFCSFWLKKLNFGRKSKKTGFVLMLFSEVLCCCDWLRKIQVGSKFIVRKPETKLLNVVTVVKHCVKGRLFRSIFNDFETFLFLSIIQVAKFLSCLIGEIAQWYASCFVHKRQGFLSHLGCFFLVTCNMCSI